MHAVFRVADVPAGLAPSRNKHYPHKNTEISVTGQPVSTQIVHFINTGLHVHAHRHRDALLPTGAMVGGGGEEHDKI